MAYICTRGGAEISASEAILKGLSDNGGLFVPKALPKATEDMLPFHSALPYAQRAQRVLELFLDDFSSEELGEIASAAYQRFDTPKVAPITALNEDVYMLELFHGPTLAFKDMALQVLPYLIVKSAKKCGEGRTISILTATSGDTGKAALEGFMDVPKTRCTVFYPLGGVSKLQEKQMLTARGENTQVIGVLGNFDDTQTGVKKLFNDAGFVEKMNKKGCVLSSANSINIGRLVPQVAYYFSAYADMCAMGALQKGEMFDVCVPTGNFGNILAAWYAREMGVPIARFICASNKNNVLTDFINTGVYNARREFYKTISPSMDILISSNLERLLFELCGRDTVRLNEMMCSLKENGRFCLNQTELARLKRDFVGVCADDEDTRAQIHATWQTESYLLDPHTAVALKGLNKVRISEDVMRRTLVVSTASPYKFAQDVRTALGMENTADALGDARGLAAYLDQTLPAPLCALEDLPVRHTQTCKTADMGGEILAARDLR